MVLGVRDHLELVAPDAWREKQAALPSDGDVWKRARAALAERSKGEGR
jgi:hypothetical protein